jgi:hypothetical protein
MSDIAEQLIALSRARGSSTWALGELRKLRGEDELHIYAQLVHSFFMRERRDPIDREYDSIVFVLHLMRRDAAHAVH